jgi:hypothetical protein
VLAPTGWLLILGVWLHHIKEMFTVAPSNVEWPFKVTVVRDYISLKVVADG